MNFAHELAQVALGATVARLDRMTKALGPGFRLGYIGNVWSRPHYCDDRTWSVFGPGGARFGRYSSEGLDSLEAAFHSGRVAQWAASLDTIVQQSAVTA